ncbi:unnamed protein product [Eruca vesicaria subsp. sativa]|uniref:10 kDa chaperonin n=1 Tax=Eruca vesicaria subsp. sativa TaxID=29727 RepID=A0ABC8L4W0_ERUVS|nr:unnamed protein product [Eruca vesicaria subsp. sativa]
MKEVLQLEQMAEEKTMEGILLPSTAQSKPQGGKVVAVEFNNVKQLILKENDIVDLLESDDIKDKPLNDPVFSIKREQEVVVMTGERR